MTNQVAAQTSRLSYTAQWQDLYTQATQHFNDNAKSDEERPGPSNGPQSGGRTAEGQSPVKRRRINDLEIPVTASAAVGLIFNENISFVDVVVTANIQLNNLNLRATWKAME